MHDKVIHDYFRADIETVWLTVSDDITVLESEIEEILHEIKRGDLTHNRMKK